ncbi:MAG: SAF domain-containing protein [Chloroflexi bacterium]|nr:SAF domain-containing protein [Chloroflexota bacterium]
MMLKQFLRFRAYIVLAIAMAAAYFTVQSATQTVQVVAAAKDLGENTVLTNERLRVISVPVGAKLPGMVEANQQVEIVGMVTRAFIPAGYPITRPYLQPPTGSGSNGPGVTAAIADPRNVLFPLSAPSERVAMGGSIVPGEYVDVYLVWEDPTVRETGKGAREKATLYLQHQKVFYYDGKQMAIEVPKLAAAVLAYATKVGELVVAPSRVDEVLAPNGELTVDVGVFRNLFGKPVSGTIDLRDLYGREEAPVKGTSKPSNPAGTEKTGNEKPKP